MENKGCSERRECASKFICKDSCPYKDRVKQSSVSADLIKFLERKYV